MSVASVLTAIGDKLRGFLGVTTKYKLEEMPDAIDNVVEAVKQTEYDRFWDEFQTSGNRTGYGYAFGYDGWSEETFKPKYPIGTGKELSINYAFYKAARIKKIPLIKSLEYVNYNSTFTGCAALEEVWFDGLIGRAISFADSPNLKKACMEHVVGRLNSTGGYLATFNKQAVTKAFTASEWGALIGTRENWDFSPAEEDIV